MKRTTKILIIIGSFIVILPSISFMIFTIFVRPFIESPISKNYSSVSIPIENEQGNIKAIYVDIKGMFWREKVMIHTVEDPSQQRVEMSGIFNNFSTIKTQNDTLKILSLSEFDNQARDEYNIRASDDKMYVINVYIFAGDSLAVTSLNRIYTRIDSVTIKKLSLYGDVDRVERSNIENLVLRTTGTEMKNSNVNNLLMRTAGAKFTLNENNNIQNIAMERLPDVPGANIPILELGDSFKGDKILFTGGFKIIPAVKISSIDAELIIKR